LPGSQLPPVDMHLGHNVVPYAASAWLLHHALRRVCALVAAEYAFT
jgi:hypothetical protein